VESETKKVTGKEMGEMKAQQLYEVVFSKS
jgi:hypothetical protein